MSSSLTALEIEKQKNFLFIAGQYQPSCPLDSFNIQFHWKMQNPKNGSVVFDSVSRSYLHNGNLCTLRDYFTESSGKHLFGKTIDQLTIRNTCLKGYYRGLDQMPDGTVYIADLIRKNPEIKRIDLTKTELGDEEARQLLAALGQNTNLCELDLRENAISPELSEKIAQKIEANRRRWIQVT